MKIDNFALTMHQACPLKYRYRMVEGWTSRRRSGALGFGAAFHAGLAEWYRSTDTTLRAGDAINAISKNWDYTVPEHDYRTLQKCIETFDAYTREYPQENFQIIGWPDAPIVEQTFTLPLGTFLDCRLSFVDEPEKWEARKDCNAQQDMFEPVCACGLEKERIDYGGIFDGLVEFNNKAFVFEHKTTSQLGDYYFSQFNPNNQVTGYIWAAGVMSGLEVAGAMINAIGVYKVSKPKFLRNITTRSPLDIQRWIINVTATCNEIQSHAVTGYWPQRTISCTQYGLCEFHQVDILADPAWRQKRLEQDYVKDSWDYTRRDENSET